MMLNNIDLNLIIALSLSVLAFFTFCIFVILIPVAMQLNRTLSSAQFLLDSINDDLQPTVKEVKESIDNVKQLVRSSTKSVSVGINEAGILVVSSVHGLLTGVKDYLSSYKNNETSYNGKRKTEF